MSSILTVIKDYFLIPLLLSVSVAHSVSNCKGTSMNTMNIVNRRNGSINWDGETMFVDTTKPKYDPNIQVKFSQLYLKKIDTLDIIVNNYLGRSMTVDNTDQIKSVFFRITRELRNDTARIK